MKTLKLKVNGIHCNGCVTKIKNGINELDHSSETNVNIDSGEVLIKIDPKATNQMIKDKITAVGFSVESLEIE